MIQSLRLKLFILITIAVLANLATAPMALAHEGREVGNFKFVVGFATEPALEAQPNAVSLRVTQSTDAHHSDELATTDAHGAIFGSPVLTPGDVFQLSVGAELAGLHIPYHSHLDPDATGTIVVDETGEPGMVHVTIHEGELHPKQITVAPGATIMWANKSSKPQGLVSGLHDAAMAKQAHHESPVEGLENSLSLTVAHLSTGVTTTMPLSSQLNEPGLYRSIFIPTAPGKYRFTFIGSIHGTTINETFESGTGTFDEVTSLAEVQFPTKLPSMREMEGVARASREAALSAQAKAADAYTFATIGIVIGGLGMLSGAGGVWLSLSRRAKA